MKRELAEEFLNLRSLSQVEEMSPASDGEVLRAISMKDPAGLNKSTKRKRPLFPISPTVLAVERILSFI
jgi:hypothetical protein